MLSKLLHHKRIGYYAIAQHLAWNSIYPLQNREEYAMEGRAHAGKNYISQDPKSRTIQDFASFSDHFHSHFKQRSAAPTNDLLESMIRKDGNLHVGITGAGLAGLRSAEVLVEEGIKVTIIEARDRLGGRVSSFRS